MGRDGEEHMVGIEFGKASADAGRSSKQAKGKKQKVVEGGREGRVTWLGKRQASLREAPFNLLNVVRRV